MNQEEIGLRLWEMEKKNLQKSAVYTTLIITLMFLFGIIWVALRGTIPPPDEKQYIVAGSIDFGDLKMGSQNVNNFQKSSDTPSDQVQSDPAKVQESSSTPTANTNENLITSEVESEVSTPANENPTVEPDKTIKPQVSEPIPIPPKKEKEKADKPSNTDVSPDKKTGGSNQGDNKNSTGNRGTDAPVLDEKGLYSFGSGEDGLMGRKALSLPTPTYNVQQEAKLTFTFTIAPSGRVKYVKPPITKEIGLKKAGMEAIYTWKFDPIPDHKGDQTTKVTITFKLRN